MVDYAKILVQIKWSEREIKKLTPRFEMLQFMRDSKQKQVAKKYALVSNVKSLAEIEEEIAKIEPRMNSLKERIDDLLTWGSYELPDVQGEK